MIATVWDYQEYSKTLKSFTFSISNSFRTGSNTSDNCYHKLLLYNSVCLENKFILFMILIEIEDFVAKDHEFLINLWIVYMKKDLFQQ